MSVCVLKTFDDPRDAQDAVRKMHGEILDGNKIAVELSKGERK
jgi:RNA recognition motif-containing protein